MLVGEIMQREVFTLDEEELLESALRRMIERGVRDAPVLRAGRVVGTLSVLAQAQAARQPLRRSCAVDVMQRDVEFAHAEDSVLDAALRMLQGGVRQLPVLDGEGRVMGVVSERDVQKVVGNTRALIESRTRRDRLEGTSVAEVMTGDAATAEFDTPLDQLAQRLLEEQAGALLIVDGQQRLVGSVNYADVLRALLAREAAA